MPSVSNEISTYVAAIQNDENLTQEEKNTAISSALGVLATAIDTMLTTSGSTGSVSTLSSQISSDLAAIGSARLGEQVRGSICSAISKIAEGFDNSISAYNAEIRDAANRATLAATNANTAAQKASEAETDISQAQQSAERINGLANSLSQEGGIIVNKAEYVYSAATGKYEPPTPTITYNSARSRLEFTLPYAPKFSTLIANWISKSSTNVLEPSRPEIEYNPNNGNLTLNIPNKLSWLDVKATAIDNPNGDAQPTINYDPALNKLTLGIPRGASGENVRDVWKHLNFRPMIPEKPLWRIDSGSKSQYSTFDQQSVLSRNVGALFDAFLIVFHKSVSNYGDGAMYQYGLEPNPSAGVTKGTKITFSANKNWNNNDAKNVVTCFLPRSKSDLGMMSDGIDGTIVSYTDPFGFTFIRQVKYLSSNHSEYCSGGAFVSKKTTMKTWPNVRFGNSAYGSEVAVGSPFTNAIYFSDVKVITSKGILGGNRTKTWYGTPSLETGYSNTSPNSADRTEMDKARRTLNTYNKFLVPIAIYGIRYDAPITLPADIEAYYPARDNAYKYTVTKDSSGQYVIYGDLEDTPSDSGSSGETVVSDGNGDVIEEPLP